MYFRIILAAALASALLSSQSHAGNDCRDKWPVEAGPQFACVTLTNALLVSLEGANRMQVIKAMDAPGRPIRGNAGLQYLIPVGDVAGYVNFHFGENGRVIAITTALSHDSDDSNTPSTPVHFVWRKDLYSCSDFPGTKDKGTDCAKLQEVDNQAQLQKDLESGGR